MPIVDLPTWRDHLVQIDRQRRRRVAAHPRLRLRPSQFRTDDAADGRAFRGHRFRPARLRRQQAAPRPATWRGHAEQVYGFLQAAKLGRVHLHGTSFGAMIGLSLAVAHPEVFDKLVFSCFLARYDNAARMMRSTWKRTAQR